MADEIQSGALMQRNVIGLIALDFVLRVVFARMVNIPLVMNVFCVDLHDPAANASSLGIPGYVGTHFEAFGHATAPRLAIDLEENAAETGEFRSAVHPLRRNTNSLSP
jgi:hypothetical protein